MKARRIAQDEMVRTDHYAARAASIVDPVNESIYPQTAISLQPGARLNENASSAIECKLIVDYFHTRKESSIGQHPYGAPISGAILPFHPSHLEGLPFCLLNDHS